MPRDTLVPRPSVLAFRGKGAPTHRTPSCRGGPAWPPLLCHSDPDPERSEGEGEESRSGVAVEVAAGEEPSARCEAAATRPAATDGPPHLEIPRRSLGMTPKEEEGRGITDTPWTEGYVCRGPLSRFSICCLLLSGSDWYNSPIFLG